MSAATNRAKHVGLDEAGVDALDDDALEERLYGPRGGSGRRDPDRPSAAPSG
ncbi:MAG: hypothetical protein IPM79_11255 [Polyangiaceae bacterium]|nr:hypothetical protein [Polyangiaceae bacterium]MBK8938193.1 hypothetical protein [Polyangiaceae bacterium]